MATSTDKLAVLGILLRMGASNAEFVEQEGHDDRLTFSFEGLSVEVIGTHCNDGTGGLNTFVSSLGDTP